MSKRRFQCALLGAVAPVIGLCTNAFSQVSTWTHVGNGTFNVASNWAGGVPTSASTALFNLNNTYTVTFNANAASNVLSLTNSGAIVTLLDSTATHAYTIGSSASINSFLTLNGVSLAGTTPAGIPNLNLTSTTVLDDVNSTIVCQNLSMNNAFALTFYNLTLDGPGASLTSTGLGENFISSSGGSDSALQVSAGATISFAGLLGLADTTGNEEGFISVDGTGTFASIAIAPRVGNTIAQFTSSGVVTQTGSSSITIGAASSSLGLLSIDGGTFTTGTGRLIVNTTGNIDLSAGTLILNNGSVLIDGGVFQRSGTGTYTLTSGQAFTIQNGGVGSFAASLNITGGSTFTVTGTKSLADLGPGILSINGNSVGTISAGAAVACSGLDIGNGSNGSLSVNAAALNPGAGAANNVGVNGGTGTLSLVSATAPISTDLLSVGTGAGINRGTVSINNSILTLNNLLLGSSGSAGSTGEMDLVGTSTSVTVNGIFGKVGGFSTPGTLSISGGTFTNNGNFSADHDGTITLSAGTFVNNGFLDVLGQLSVGAGATFNSAVGSTTSLAFGGVGTISSFFTPAGTISVGNGGGVTGTLHLLNTVSASPTTTMIVNSGGLIDIPQTLFPGGGTYIVNGGTLSMGSLALSFSPAHFIFNGGTIQFPTAQVFDFAMLSTLLSDTPVPTLLPGRNLVINTAAVFTSPLVLDGGMLSVGSITPGGTFLTLKSGTLSLMGSSLAISTGGVLGSIVNVGPGMTINAPTIALGSGGFLNITGGTVSTGTLTNNGGAEINLTSPTASLAAVNIFNANSALIHGTGVINGALNNQIAGIVAAATGERLVLTAGLTNFGTVSLTGGELDLQTAASNFAPGYIAGRGILRTHGVNNFATIALSAGLSDFTGTLTNNGTVIVTGGGTATFYDNVNNGTASLFRVSTNSTAVFLGSVTGLAAFTGNGIKDFEGSASGGPILTTGSSIVGSSTSLIADSIRENSLTVIGLTRINANGGAIGASHLKTLTIDGATDNWDGRFDLTNNALVLDYDGASPLATVANQIKTAFHGGDWHGNGLTSSLASSIAPHPTAVGFVEASALGSPSTFLGQPADSTSILVRYVFTGDANLDGVVNALDFNALATNFGGGAGKLWNQGDFNYDGVINSADFTSLAVNFNSTLPAPALGSVVPEPVSLISLAAMSAICIRRRKQAH